MKHEEVVETVANWFKSKSNIMLVRKGSGEFPDPDVYVQSKNGVISFTECKGSGAGGREYLTGFGQAIAYATMAHYSYLAVPEKEMNKFKRFFWVKDIGLLSVSEDGDVNQIRKPQKFKPTQFYEKRTRAYGYYRDLHPEEIYEILEAIAHVKNENERRNEIWRTVCKLRNIKSQRQKNAWTLNIKLLLRDLGVINYDLSLTEKGFSLLQLGRMKNKKLYLTELTKCFLFDANYIDLIALIHKLNNKYTAFRSLSHFKGLLEKEIIKEKLATPQTNIMRDLQDIPRILRELGVLSDWHRHGFGYRYTIDLQKITQLLK